MIYSLIVSIKKEINDIGRKLEYLSRILNFKPSN